MNLPKINYLVEGLIPEIGLTMFQGHPGTNKSWFAYYLAYCAANGLPLLNTYKTKKASVLLVCPDDYLPTMQERLAILGLDPNVDISVLNPEKILDVGSPEFDRFLDYIEKEKHEVVIIDTLRNIHRADENDSSQMDIIMQRLRLLAKNRCVVLIHHLNKNTLVNTVVASRGSTVIPAALISGFNFKKNGEYRLSLTQFKNKIGRLHPELRLEFNEQMRGIDIFNLDLSRPKEEVQSSILKVIKEAYEENPTPELTKNEFKDLLHGSGNGAYSKNEIDKAYSELIKQGFLCPDGIRRQANRICYIKNPCTRTTETEAT